MLTFQTGQKARLADLGAGTTLSVTARVTGPAPEYDLILFGLDDQGRLTDDRYMIFYNQPRSPEGALAMQGGARGEKTFTANLGALPPGVRRLSLAATVDGAASFGQIDHAEVTVHLGGAPVASYRVTGRDFQAQRAVMLLDVYHKDVWRVGAVGQGFNGGLDALVRHFGGQVADTPAARPPAPAPAPTPAPAPAPPPTPTPTAAPSASGGLNFKRERPRPEPAPAPTSAAPPAAPVSLQKITLEKPGQTARISLRKGGGSDPIRVNLNWNKGGGFLRGRTDLDLGCMYVMNDGERGVIQALGNRFGSDRFEPFILLDKDDRTGAASDGENLTIHRPDLIHTVLIFAFIYEGTSDFTRVGGRLTMKDPRGNEISVNLSNPDMRRTFCAIAQIENHGGEIQITKEERYFTGHKDCDEHYGFGFQWSAGSK
ncbi:TerD family protein [Deinococcus knuensis]|uniref:Tellurium resistance protein TerA n=1 Tax=Deinococcus knuensis TaxID=1837380 RepID=A0ABQ2SQZ8_9DEIO|nr:TerD family protein [Deinococcus knuensis]GGS37304.1 tellurium resistance protein TerA [Deinococcus knuensis]